MKGRSKLSGARRVRKAVREAPVAVQRAIVEELQAVGEAVHAEGLANMDAAFGTSEKGFVEVRGKRYPRQQVRRRYTLRIAPRALRVRIGYLTPSAQRAAYYARFLHDGTRFFQGSFFHMRAVERGEVIFELRAGVAFKRALRKAFP